MAYTAQQLISRSWYLSGIVRRNAQQITGDQITDGLNMLNALLDMKALQVDLIPYYTYIEFPLTIGQEYYPLPHVTLVESATFNLSVVRYPMQQLSRIEYFASSRVDDIQSLVFNWNFNRGTGGGQFSVYPLPGSDYICKLMIKLFLQDVSLNTDLTNIAPDVPYTFLQPNNVGFDGFYIEYLRYALAEYMCSEYGIQFNPQSEAILRKYELQLKYVEAPDLTMKRMSILTNTPGLNYGDVNIGQGYRPVW